MTSYNAPAKGLRVVSDRFPIRKISFSLAENSVFPYGKRLLAIRKQPLCRLLVTDRYMRPLFTMPP